MEGKQHPCALNVPHVGALHHSDFQILLITTLLDWTRLKGRIRRATRLTNSLTFKVAPRTLFLNHTLIGLMYISWGATWEYTNLHFRVSVDGGRQMNINSTVSHYQAGIIMMNAILCRVSPQVWHYTKSCSSGWKNVTELVQADKRKQGWRKIAFQFDCWFFF